MAVCKRKSDVQILSYTYYILCETRVGILFLPKTYYNNILFLICGTRVITEICTRTFLLIYARIRGCRISDDIMVRDLFYDGPRSHATAAHFLKSTRRRNRPFSDL